MAAAFLLYSAVWHPQQTWAQTAQGTEAAKTAGDRQVESPGRTGRPLPRFATLRAEVVNLRTGPGTRYPIDWVIKRQNFPIEIVDEFENWRRIRDWEGTNGWVHSSMLVGRRMAQIMDKEQVLLSDINAGAKPVARLAPGALGRIEQCEGDWCLLEFSGYQGYLRRHQFYGSYPHETLE
ncbi:SH3 domain-containing protein [Rhodovibrionaceae bacterium A322]